MSHSHQIPESQPWIATVTLETIHDKYPGNNIRKNREKNEDRMNALRRIIIALAESPRDGVIVFPGGWFHEGTEPAESGIPAIERRIKNLLQKIPSHIIVGIGIDGSLDDQRYDRDQIALALDKTGIIAGSRKFQVRTYEERERVNLAPDYRTGDFGRPRIFVLNGIRFFPAICYDIYGPQQHKLENPGVDVIISHVHYFVPVKEDGPKGVVDFVRKGFAGASAQWNCPVFGAGIFVRRPIPTCWRTGMYYRSFPKPYIKCSIEENSLPVEKESEYSELQDGRASIQKFSLPFVDYSQR
jgi:hypothetical protein